MTEPTVLDADALERLKDWGGENLLRQMLRLFLENAPERMEAIRNGVDTADCSVAERGAHSLKSSAGNVGAGELNRTAAEMEGLASAEDRAGMEELLPRLEDVYERSRVALAQLMEELGDEA